MTDPNEPYLRRAQEALDRAKTKVEKWRGECSSCAYSSRDWLDGETCHHPAVELVSFNLTDAYAKKRIVSCGEQRDQASTWGPVVCGPNGALFEERPKNGFLSGLRALIGGQA